MGDLRQAIRDLLVRPGYHLLVILTLALGLGANTAIFSVAEATLLRSLPVEDERSLVSIQDVRAEGQFTRFETSYPDLLDWRARARSFTGLAGWAGNRNALTSDRGTEQVRVGFVTGNFFQLLGVAPALGHDLRDDEPNAILLSHTAWRERFNGDPAIVGRSVTLDGDAVTIAGVLPRSFAFAPVGSPVLWRPGTSIGGDFLSRRSLHWINIVGRLRPGVDLAAAQHEMTDISASLERENPGSNAGIRAEVGPLRALVLGNIQPIVLLLLGAAGLVLLIACADVAHLTLARANGRRREMAIRVALGASRRRIVRQLVTESLVSSVLGGALGILLSMWGVDLILAAIPGDMAARMPYLRGVGVDVGTLLFAFGAALVTGAAVGVLPAMSVSRPDVQRHLREEAGGSTDPARRRLRDTLIVAEVAIAFVLLAGAGLVGRSLVAMLGRDPGFDPRGLLTADLHYTPPTYNDDVPIQAANQRILDRLAALPGVTAVATTSGLPLSGGNNTIRYRIVGRAPHPSGVEDEANIRVVSTNYLTVMKLAQVSGRRFGAEDTAATRRVVIINKTLAARLFPGEDPVGKQLVFTYNPAQPLRDIVGVVGDENLVALDAAVTPTIYLPITQDAVSGVSVVIRGDGTRVPRADEVRRAVAEVDPAIAVANLSSMEDRVAAQPWMFVRRFPVLLVGAFALLALLLAAVGIYGVVSHSVGQRRREIGIRRAVGAGERQIARLILRESLGVVAIGLGVGLAGALAVGRVLGGFLYQVSAYDPLTLGAAGLFLVALAAAASWLPARKALRVDPMEVLR